MRPVQFTADEIIEAGQTLVAEGRNVTGFALRERVGGGNAARLKQVWDEHASSKSVVEAEVVAELPVEVAEQLAQLTKALTTNLSSLAVALNDRAVKASERRVREVVSAASDKCEQADRELADASNTVDDLEQQLDAATDDGNALKKQLSRMQAEKQAQAVALAQLRVKFEALEVNASQVSADLIYMQKQLEQIRTSEREARELAAKLGGQLEAVNAQNVALLAGLPGFKNKVV